MEKKSIILNSKRCYATAFPEPKTEHEAETSHFTKQLCFGTKREPEANQEVKTEDKVKPAKFMLFGVDLLSPPEKNPKDALFAYIKSTLGGDQELTREQPIMQRRKLTNSDVHNHQSRLAIPGKTIKNTKFLTDSEEGWLQLKNGKGKKNRLGVKVFGSSLLPGYDLDLTRWNYASKGNRYVLNKEWMHFMKENHLEEGQLIQVWSFRIKDKYKRMKYMVDSGRLCFAIVSLEK